MYIQRVKKRHVLATSTIIIVWSSYFSLNKNSMSSKRSDFFKNLIVDFKIDLLVLTLKYFDPYKGMFKSLSTGKFVRDESTVDILARSSAVIIE